MDIYEVKFTITCYVAHDPDDSELEQTLEDWEYEMLAESDSENMTREVRKIQSLDELSETARKSDILTDADEAEDMTVEEAFHLDLNLQHTRDELLDRLSDAEQAALGLVEGYEEARRTGLEKLTLEERSLLGI